MKAQVKLPYCTPTPREARQKLREAKLTERNARNAVDGLKEHLKATKLELEAAEAELEQVERNLLDAPDETDEAAVADAEHAKAWKRVLVAERGIENLESTIGAAKVELADARRVLRGAREDAEAVRMGRRKK